MNKFKQTIDTREFDKYDPVSKLYSRKYFHYITDKMLQENCDETFVMINIDIYNFKLINEIYGDSQGDVLLKQLGEEIIRFFENDNKVSYSREQADIFFVCFKYEEKRVNEFIEYMADIINEKGRSLPVKLYFGVNIISEYVKQGLNILYVCDCTRLALKKLKGNHINSVSYFDESMKEKFDKKIAIINDMNTALKRGDFELYLQPKCNIVTNSCIGAEALVRWNHPEKGLIRPDEFIPIFEKNEFIMKLDEYMFEKACILIRKWIDENRKPIPISVNVSQVYLKNELLYDTFTNLIEKYEVPVEFIELEITETAYIENNEKLNSRIKRLQDYGFKIHMDDFGSGYSSLSLLSELPVDVIKMDMRFLDNLTESSKGKSIVSMVVGLAKSLGVEIIVEGIENISHLTFLQNVGCVVGQGYHFSRPVKVNEFEEKFLNSNDKSMFSYDMYKEHIYKKLKSGDLFWNVERLGRENEVLLEALAECRICVWEYDILNKRIIQTDASRSVHGNNKVIEDVPNSLIESGHVHEESIEEFKNMYKLLESGARKASCIVKVKKQDGSYWWEKINYVTSFDEDGRAVRALGLSNDVTNIMASKMDKNDELFKIAYRDELTGIGNRRACFNYINELINNKNSFSISYIDLDCLKYVNDKFGHEKGDEYLKQFADVIKSSIRADEEVFRIGGDEFIYIDKNNDTDFIDERLLLLNSKLKSLNLDHKCSISYGTIYVKADDEWTCKEIISRADEKMYIYKKRKKKNCCVKE